jgi:hypothetical protein
MLPGVTGKLLVPPSALPSGARGIRGPLAAVATLGAVVCFAMGAIDDDPTWTGPALNAAGAGLLVGAILLWTSSRSIALVFGVVLALGATAGAIASEVARSNLAHEREKWLGASFGFTGTPGRVVSETEAEAVPDGTSRDALIARFGPATARGVQNVDGEPSLHCLAYRAENDRPIDSNLHAFCFRDGQLEAVRRW